MATAEDLVSATQEAINVADASALLGAVGAEASEVVAGFLRGEFRLAAAWDSVRSMLESLDAITESRDSEKEKNRTVLEDLKRNLNANVEEQRRLAEEQSKMSLQVEALKEKLREERKEIRALKKLNSAPLIKASGVVEKVAKELNETLKSQTPLYLYSSLLEHSEYPKLSLLFNAGGLDEATISKLAEVDGSIFLSSDIGPLLTDCGVNDRLKRIDVAYLRLIAQGNLDLVSHVDECPVCGSQSSSDVQSLLKEMSLLWPLPIGQDMTGKRMLGLGVSELRQLGLPKEQLKLALSIVSSLQRTHFASSSSVARKEGAPWQYRQPIEGDSTQKGAFCWIHIMDRGCR